MTEAKYKYNGDRYELKITGHATGSPKTCAGISAIAQSLEGWMINNKDKLKIHRCEMKSGEFSLFLCSDDKEVRAVFDMAIIGLLQIEKSYGKFLTVESM